MTSSRPTRPRARSLALTGILAGAVLAIAIPMAASAHVEVSPNTAPAGAEASLSFTFHHGCDDSPTTALVVDIPKGVANATPVVQGGWTITRVLNTDGVPTQVTFTADQPVETGLRASVGLDVLFAEDAADTTVAFPVVQQCVTGSTSWTEIPADGEDEDSVEHPAPAVELGAAVATDDDGNPVATPDASATAEASAGDVGSSDDVLARWLGGIGLVAGLAALAVALFATRRQPKA